jgi:hypothetical protein
VQARDTHCRNKALDMAYQTAVFSLRHQPVKGLFLISWTWVGALHRSLLMLAIGIALLDFAVQAVHVTNQGLIFAARPDARSRLVAAHMVFYSVGSGIGAPAGTRTYAAFHWKGVRFLVPLSAWQPLRIWGLTISRR